MPETPLAAATWKPLGLASADVDTKGADRRHLDDLSLEQLGAHVVGQNFGRIHPLVSAVKQIEHFGVSSELL